MILDFEQDKAYVTFVPEEGIEAQEYFIKVFATNAVDGGSPTLVYTSKTYGIKQDDNKWFIVIDYSFYSKAAKKIGASGKPLPNIIDFSFKVVIDEEENEVASTFSIHFVRYIPKLLTTLGFTNAEKLQRIWFTKGNNIDKDTVDPIIDAVSFDWAIAESSQVNTEYRQFLIETGTKLNNNYHLLGNKIRDSLKSEIEKMINEGIVNLPTENNNQPFGVTNSQIITYRGEKIPEYEKYYFESKPFSGFFDLGIHFAFDGLDDFIASLANFNYHLFATGELEYNTSWLGDTIDINVKQFGVYIKDSFDFIDDNPAEASQPLGYWKINDDKTIEVERETNETSEYFEVTNKSYREYRDAHGMGYNYHLYSTVKLSSTNYKVKLKDA